MRSVPIGSAGAGSSCCRARQAGGRASRHDESRGLAPAQVPALALRGIHRGQQAVDEIACRRFERLHHRAPYRRLGEHVALCTAIGADRMARRCNAIATRVNGRVAQRIHDGHLPP